MRLQAGVLDGLAGRRFGRLGWQVKPIGLGGAWLRGRGQKLSIEEGAQTVLQALELGVDFIDTSIRYGDSELVIGEALKDLPRDQWPRIATKSQIIKEGSVADGIVGTCEDSLQRLGTDHIELFQIHEADTYGFDRIMGPDGALEGLRRCQQFGYCEGIGVTGRRTPELTALVETGEFDSVLTFYEYDLATVAATHDLMPAAKQHDVAVIAGSPARMGLFAVNSVERLERHPAEIQARIPKLEALLGKPYYELANDSIRFLLADPAIQSIVIGSSRIESLENSIEAALLGPLPDDVVQQVFEICGG